MGRTCSFKGRDEKCIQIFSRNSTVKGTFGICTCMYVCTYIYLFICDLFNDAVKECIINWWPNLSLCLNISMEGL